MINVPIHRIELNTTELCNRKCSFCPRAYDYPNLNLHMTADTAEEVILQTNEYTNYLCIAGRGEPLLCENILEIIELMVNDGLKIYNLKVDKFRDFGTPENFEIEKNK